MSLASYPALYCKLMKGITMLMYNDIRTFHESAKKIKKNKEEVVVGLTSHLHGLNVSGSGYRNGS